MSDAFTQLRGGVRTRRLADQIMEQCGGDPKARRRAEAILKLLGVLPRKEPPANEKGEVSLESAAEAAEASKMLVFTTKSAIAQMAGLLTEGANRPENELAAEFADLISKSVAVPDMALSGRMLQPDKAAEKIWAGRRTDVPAALQAAHAISTHEAMPEVDYYVAADDVPGPDAGAGFVDEAVYSSACFYKYFSIDWEQLKTNLRPYGDHHPELAAHTVGAFLKAAATVTPTGKQNSFAAHNPPEAILVEFRDMPISYANAFAQPVSRGDRSLIGQSVAQLAHYVSQMDIGYGGPDKRIWFSPGDRWPFKTDSAAHDGPKCETCDNLERLIEGVVAYLGFDWQDVQKTVAAPEAK